MKGKLRTAISKVAKLHDRGFTGYGEALPICFERPHEIDGYMHALYSEIVAENMIKILYAKKLI